MRAWHDIPNTIHLREKGVRKEGKFKKVHNQMGDARHPKSTKHSRLAHIYMLTSAPFLLDLGDHALAPNVLAPCVYMQRQRQETSKQAMEGKDAKNI